MFPGQRDFSKKSSKNLGEECSEQKEQQNVEAWRAEQIIEVQFDYGGVRPDLKMSACGHL